MKRQAKEWLHFSKTDLMTAEKILLEEEISTSTAFHCHQSVEKALKAILENIEHRFPKTHDLLKLLSLVRERGFVIDVETTAIVELDSVYIDARYPVDLGLVPEGRPSLERVKRFYETAKSIHDQVAKTIREESNADPGE